MSRALVFVFPGQSSRDATMFERLGAVSRPHAERAQASLEEALGRPFDGTFATNLEVQLAVWECTMAYLGLALEAGLQPTASAGLSLGEYAHVVANGALSEAGARALVKARGACYDQGPSGCMAALYPMAASDAEQVCAHVRQTHFGGDPAALAVSNFNSPLQCVIAGTHEAVEVALAHCEEHHFVNGQVIEQRVPMHMARFQTVAQAFLPALQAAPWQVPHSAYWPNVAAQPLHGASADDFVSHLARHVHEPVQWHATVEALRSEHDNPVFVEVGPLQVLTKLMNRRWVPAQDVFALDLMAECSPASWTQRLTEIRHALAH